ncbi:MAG: prephenate dehydrogenase/arogenate dehydrogenase family protein [Gemmatimonadales bacterium]
MADGTGGESQLEGGADARLRVARSRIADVDRELMTLVAERMRLATDVGEAKRALGLPVRSFGTEAEVLTRYRAAAAAAGLEHEFAEAVALLLIDGAVRRQEELSGRAAPTQAQSVVVVGGAGKMGRWFRGFFEGQGHHVRVIDPSLPPGDPARASDEELAEADLVVVAVSLAATPRVLSQVLAAQPRGLVLDIASLKSHLIEPLRAAAASGLRVASLHPLFGPGVRTLGGRVMAVCDCGNPAAADEAAALFADTAVTITRLPVEEHDRYMQYVLGLSHLVSLLFAATVTRSGMATVELNAMASTTWLKQVRTAAEVVGENPEMYYEIQRLNRHSAELFALVRDQLGVLESAALADDPSRFVALMTAAREFLPAEPGRVLG